MLVERRICVGKIAGAHGVRGLVRLRSYTADPADLVGYALTDADGVQSFRPVLKSVAGDTLIVSLDGVADRDAANALRGVQLYVSRDALPALSERSFYQADLIGLTAVDPSGATVGTVTALHDFGAGGILEVTRGVAQGGAQGGAVMVPFRDAFVPVVDLAAGRVTVDLPQDWLAPATEEKT